MARNPAGSLLNSVIVDDCWTLGGPDVVVGFAESVGTELPHGMTVAVTFGRAAARRVDGDRLGAASRAVGRDGQGRRARRLRSNGNRVGRERGRPVARSWIRDDGTERERSWAQPTGSLFSNVIVKSGRRSLGRSLSSGWPSVWRLGAGDEGRRDGRAAALVGRDREDLRPAGRTLGVTVNVVVAVPPPAATAPVVTGAKVVGQFAMTVALKVNVRAAHADGSLFWTVMVRPDRS